MNSFPRLCLALVALLSCAIENPARAQAFDPVLSIENLWSLDQDGFQRATPGLPFAWTSAAKDSARAASRGMTLFGLPIYEVVGRFDGGKLREITAAFYARGDAGDLTKERYDALVRGSAEALTNFTKTKFTVRGKDEKSAVKAEGLVWTTDKARFLLEYSATREVKTRDIPFRAEFVRVEITPPDRRLSLLTTAADTSQFTGQLHVKRDASRGDVWLHDVPMVDQGQKGYCVVAATERVMRFYGKQVDANELAQIANTATEGGTSLDAMLAALKKVAARFKVRVREVEEQDVKAVLDLIKDYNRAAKRAKQPEIPDPGNMIDVGGVYRAMKFEVLKDAKTRNKSDLSRFQRAVQTHVDQGIPLLWCVQLGFIPEPGVPQSGGGHMRLIIGYNTKTQEILFSDSWGAGHELKRMPAGDAWTITTAVTTIEPI